MNRSRLGVLWFGAAPNEQTVTELKNRDLPTLIIADAKSLPDLSTKRAAVFAFTRENARALAAQAARHAPTLINYGLSVDLIASDDGVLGEVQGIFGAVPLVSQLTVRTAPAPFEIPERIARHQPGAPPRLNLEISMAHNRPPIRREDEPLFQRAFSGCSKIALVELTGGRSAARIFAVHMTVDTSLAGAWPQPFFAKLDVREKIQKEFQNYRDFADRFIPFGLRPNVQDIVHGAERSLLYGDFVDRSESLWDLVRRNVGAQAISSLVEQTLIGWRNQAYASDPLEGSVASAMEKAGICQGGKVDMSHLEYAQRNGFEIDPRQLWRRLTSMENQKYRAAPIHGDLHGENVRIRDGQAILIDLASAAHRGPLTADLAALETWLAFELPPEEDAQEYQNPIWIKEIERLYAPAAFSHPPGPCEPTSKYCWMATAVRQIRHMGLAAQCCATEYQTAVAVQLLRRCRWSGDTAADNFRRSNGYVTAIKLVEGLIEEPKS